MACVCMCLSVCMCVCVCSDEHDLIKNARKTDILEKNGFKCMLVRRNCMCRHLQYVPSSARVKSELKIWDGAKYGGKYTSEATVR